jgi:hypothetical protein
MDELNAMKKSGVKDVSTKEAGLLLGCTSRTIRNMIARKSIKATMYKIDPNTEKGVLRIPLSEIERVIKNRSQ